MGLDPALGGGCSLTVCNLTNDKLYVVDNRVDYGLAQVEAIFENVATFGRRYEPSLLIVEYDAQQKGIGNDDRLAALGALLGFAIRPHLTRNTKHQDPVFGLASMNQTFIKKEISIPWGDEESKRRMENLVTQLRSWRPDIPTKKLRQDAVMSLWFVWRYWMQIRKQHETVPQAQWRPSWVREHSHARPTVARVGAR